MFLDPTEFEVIAGFEVVNEMREFRKERVRITETGFRNSDELCEIQRQEERRGFIGVEIVRAIAGASVRYDSGLRDFGLVASSFSLGGTIEAAEEFARKWVTVDSSKRYAWKRK